MNIGEFKDNLVPFKVSYLVSTEVVWFDQQGICDASGEHWDSARFKQAFSYAVSENWISDASIFDCNTVKTLYAERYGSVGLGGNGGGARCGNLGQFQLKGMGKNPLAGSTDEWHSYGGFSLTEATTELINAQVLNKVLPLGAVPCYGLIFSGKDTAYTPYHTANYRGGHTVGKGALLVREACLRPAHFLENPSYCVPESLKSSVVKDRIRMKRVLKQLVSPFENNEDLIAFLATFVANCANQMAFAKLFRLYHGAFTVNNVAIDGRWLDLTNVSFVPAGRNYQNAKNLVSFNDEHHSPMGIVDELVYNIRKYLGIDFNPAPLADYYYDQYQAYLQLHLLTLLGVDVDLDTVFAQNEDLIDPLVDDFLGIILSGEKPYDDIPTIKQSDDTTKDPVSCRIKQIFSAVLHQDVVTDDEAVSCLRQLLTIAFAKQQQLSDFNAFVYRCYLKAIKQAVYVKLFYRGRIIEDIRKNEQSCGDEAGAQLYTDYIESILNAVDWIFSVDEHLTGVVFENHALRVEYGMESEQFVITQKLASGEQVVCRGSDVLPLLQRRGVSTKINDIEFDTCIEFIVG